MLKDAFVLKRFFYKFKMKKMPVFSYFMLLFSKMTLLCLLSLFNFVSVFMTLMF